MKISFGFTSLPESFKDGVHKKDVSSPRPSSWKDHGNEVEIFARWSLGNLISLAVFTRVEIYQLSVGPNLLALF